MSILIKLSNHLALILPGKSLEKMFFLITHCFIQARMIHLNRCTAHSLCDFLKQIFTSGFSRQHAIEPLLTLCFLVKMLQNMGQPWCSPSTVVNGRYVLNLMFSLWRLESLFLQALEVLLHEWSKDSLNKVLVFTKSVKLLDMLDFHLKAQGMTFRGLPEPHWLVSRLWVCQTWRKH